MHRTNPSKRRRIEDSGAFPDLVPSLPAKTQESSPLLSVLPAEIRNRIYVLSLESADTSAVDESHSLYRRNAFYYRPGYQQPKRIQTALLQTCQRIHDEASLLPPALNEHTFWFFRAPPHVKYASSPLEYFRKMTPKQRAQVHHLHFFTQQFFLEGDCWPRVWQGLVMGTAGRSLRGECRIAPKKMTITLRHTDWWHWESNEPLGIDPFERGRTRAEEMHDRRYSYTQGTAWGNHFTSVPSLEELVIEFETVMRKRDQLDDISRRALRWKFPIQAKKSEYLVADPESKSAYTWVGANEAELKNQRRPVSFVDSSHPHPEHGRRLAPMAPELKPLNSQSPLQTEDSSRSYFDEGMEEFYVIFLTWKRQIVEE